MHAYAKSRGADQIRSVTAQLISSFVLNLKLLACFCECTDCLVPDLVGNSEDRFSRVVVHMCLFYDLGGTSIIIIIFMILLH